jgi:hypothetical protein
MIVMIIFGSSLSGDRKGRERGKVDENLDA